MATIPNGSPTRGHEKHLTVSSTATAMGDAYPGFPKVASPGAESESDFGDTDSVPPTHKHRTLILCFDGTG